MNANEYHLSKLAEEASEVAHAALKLARHPDRAQALYEELDDIVAAIEMVRDQVGWKPDLARQAKKLKIWGEHASAF